VEKHLLPVPGMESRQSSPSLYSMSSSHLVFGLPNVCFPIGLHSTLLRMNPNEPTNELSFITPDEPQRDHHLEQFRLLLFVSSVTTKRTFSEPLSSNGLFRHKYKLSQTENYVTADCLGIKHPCGAYDQIFITV
jgi:hypothetical protein